MGHAHPDHAHPDHGHADHGHGPPGAGGHVHHAVAEQATLSLLRLSAVERLAAAGGLILLLWLAVLWATR